MSGLLGLPDPTKNPIIQDPKTGNWGVKMTEVKVKFDKNMKLHFSQRSKQCWPGR